MMPAAQPKIPHTTPEPPPWKVGPGATGAAGKAIDGVVLAAKTSEAASAAAISFFVLITNPHNATLRRTAENLAQNVFVAKRS